MTEGLGCMIITYKQLWKNIAFWNLTPCSLAEACWCFAGTCCLHLAKLRAVT
jgi:hypothetical protein